MKKMIRWSSVFVMLLTTAVGCGDDGEPEGANEEVFTASFSVPIEGIWRDRAWMNNHTYYKWIPVEFNQTITERIRMRLGGCGGGQ